MATKGMAVKSTSGTSMSQYDAKVEERLQSLEEKALTPGGNGGLEKRIAALEAKVDDLIFRLSKKMTL